MGVGNNCESSEHRPQDKLRVRAGIGGVRNKREKGLFDPKLCGPGEGGSDQCGADMGCRDKMIESGGGEGIMAGRRK